MAAGAAYGAAGCRERGVAADVARILEGKRHQVMVSPPPANVAEAARRLKDVAVGAVVVQDGDGRMVGMLSKRDVVHALVVFDSDLPTQPVAALMT